MAYLFENWQVIQGFVLWQLVDYLNKRNPNVPSIPEKLFAPKTRDLKQGKKFWKILMQAKPDWQCIYSKCALNEQDASLDHFIPWSFVCHDLLWNLAPVPRAVNSSKSDRLPSLQHYLEGFIDLQYQAIQVFLKQPQSPKLLDDYINLFRCDQQTLKHLPIERFRQLLSETLGPLEQIAANMGFTRGWVFGYG